MTVDARRVLNTAWLLAALQVLVVIQVAVVYSGIERYFWTVSKPFHYSFQSLLLLASILVLVARGNVRMSLRAWPIVAWIAFYYVWGTLVSPNTSQVAPTAASALLLNGLLFIAVVAALPDRRRVQVFAWAVQIVITINFVIEVIELHAPRLIDYFALTLNPNTLAYTGTRPAGLWAEPNEAAIAFLFGLVITWWARGPVLLIWAARIIAMGGIFLTASRSGLYPAVPLIVFLAAVDLRRTRLRLLPLRVVIPIVVVILAAALWAAFPLVVKFLVNSGVSLSTIARYLDFFQTHSAANDPSRTSLATYWLYVALHGPIQGSGVFSFQGNGTTLQGAHDVYIMVLGEVGIAGLILFLAAWIAGLRAVFRVRAIDYRDFVGLMTLWIIWALEGLASHNQFTVVTQIVFSVVLFQLPVALADESRRDAMFGVAAKLVPTAKLGSPIAAFAPP